MNPTSIFVGDYQIHELLDGYFQASSDVLTHQMDEDHRQAAIEKWGKPDIRIPVRCFCLQRGNENILIDTGAGSGWGPDYGQARHSINKLGIKPQDISTILLTHLHGDHALGLIEGAFPYFPNANIIVPHDDLAFFSNADNRDKTPKSHHGAFDVTSQITAACGDMITSATPGEVMPGIILVPLPGHTPGHSGYRIAGQERDLLLWGDVLHLHALQPNDPDIGFVFDFDGASAAQTRWSALKNLADTNCLVAGGHLDGFMSTIRDGNTFHVIATA